MEVDFQDDNVDMLWQPVGIKALQPIGSLDDNGNHLSEILHPGIDPLSPSWFLDLQSDEWVPTGQISRSELDYAGERSRWNIFIRRPWLNNLPSYLEGSISGQGM